MEPITRRTALVLGTGTVIGAAGALTGAAPAVAASPWRKLVVVTANIGRNNKSQRERAIRDVRNAVSGALPIVGWQEIREGDDDAKEPPWINQYFGDRYRNLFEWDDRAFRVPLSIPKTYDVLNTRITKIHVGKADVTPPRFITQAALAGRDNPQVRFVVANTHYVAGAWNADTDQKAEQWRRDMWRRHFRWHRDKVLGHWRDKGFPVIWTGDVNRQKMDKLMPNHEKRAFSRGIDQIGWVTGKNGTQIRLQRTTTVPMHVDSHNARVAIFQIRHNG